MTKIMLVEDEVFIQELYEMVLKKEGFEVEAYSDGNEAVKALQANTYDLVLLDIMLPGKDGLQILTELRAMPNHKDTRVIMLTNLGNEHVMEKTNELGITGYIIKADNTPFQIVEKVKEILAG
jgi:DNA-binding response OmpR family regulator